MIPIKDNIPTDRFPLVTVCLILANVVVYVVAVAHGGSLFSGPDAHELVKYGVAPYQITHPTGRTWETVFTAMFMHASILHLAGNMLFLWIFGNNIEDSTGRLRFLAFYVLGGLTALALQVAVEPNSLAPTVGAEGAIAAVLGGYIVMYRRARVLTLVLIILVFTVIEIPATAMVVVWFALQAVFGVAGLTDPTGGGGAVAHFTSLGGFVFGLLAIRAVATRRKAIPDRGRLSMRYVLLAVAVGFIAGFGLLTALDIAHTGLNWLDGLAIIILLLFTTGIVGALLEPPRKGD